MKKSNLKDVTFIIPLRIDSEDRIENIEILLSFLKKHFDTNILVLEADTEEKLFPDKSIQKIFIEDHDPVFHHTKYRNSMVKQASTKLIAVWDTDAICSHRQILDAVNLLRKNKADMVFPYDGRYYATHNLFKKVYKEAGDNISAFVENIGKFRLYHGYNFVGGAFLADKNAFCEAGMENENFYGWAPEDEERYRRWQILGYRVGRVVGPMFHLHHPRGKTSWFASRENEIRSRQEFFKICKMNPKELRAYVQSWKTTKNSKTPCT